VQGAVHAELQRAAPGGQLRGIVHQQMRSQIVQRLRDAVARQIGGAGAGHEGDMADAARNQFRAFKFAQPQHAIHPFGDQVGPAVRGAQLQRQVGMGGKKFGQGRDHQLAADAHGHVDAQPPCQPGLGGGEHGLGAGHGIDDVAGAVQKGVAVGRRHDLARGAPQKLGFQPVFKRLQFRRYG
jgi:hypothetical protein